jgi:hypothetical protein
MSERDDLLTTPQGRPVKNVPTLDIPGHHKNMKALLPSERHGCAESAFEDSSK